MTSGCNSRSVSHTRAIPSEYRLLVSIHQLTVQICACSICRKAGGYMGSANIMGDTDTLEILRGKELIKCASVEAGTDSQRIRRRLGV